MQPGAEIEPRRRRLRRRGIQREMRVMWRRTTAVKVRRMMGMMMVMMMRMMIVVVIVVEVVRIGSSGVG